MLQRGIANRSGMSELPKTFDPASIEARWYAHWESRGLFRPDAARRDAVDDRHAAAQRHRLAPHRPCARQHAAGHPDPPRAAAGQGRALGGRHRPCRHRHPDGGRTQPRQPGHQAHRLSAARRSCASLGMEGAVGRLDHPPAPASGRLVRLGARALHDGRGLQPRRHPRVRRALQAQACSTATSGW